MINNSREHIEKQVYVDALRKAARDYEELLGELSILKLLNDSFQVGLGFHDICQKLVQFLTDVMNVENASVMIMDQETQELRLLTAKSFYEDTGSIFVERAWTGKIFKQGEGIAGQVAKNRKSVLIADTHEDPRFIQAEAQKVKVRSILSLPLLHGERLHGVLNLSNSEPNAFSRRKEHALNIIASTAAVALSHAISVDELRQLNRELTIRNRELAAVVALSESLHASLDLDTVLTDSLSVLDEFDIDTVAILLHDSQSASMEVASFKTRSQNPDVRSVLECLAERFSRNVNKDGTMKPSAPKGETVTGGEMSTLRTCVGIPLMSGSDFFGMLVTLSSNERELDKAERKLLGSFRTQISLAIQNSILVSRLRKNIKELRETRHKLIQSDKLALLGEMLSGVAHEINNPLAAIMGYSELLLQAKPDSDQGREMLKRIIHCVDRSRRIVQGLLSFARKTELQKKQVDVIEILEDVIKHRNYDFTLNNVVVERDFEKPSPVVIADPNQLEQVFLNLINNAYDSMVQRDREKELTIRTRVIAGQTMRIEFLDTGCGVCEHDRNRVFEPFFTTKEVGKGTGLGLSVSYGIIKEHDGNLFLDESYSGGAKFVVTLPIADWTQQTPRAPDDKDTSDDSPTQRGTILVVDDEEVVTDFVQVALSSEGFVVDCACDGEEGFQKLCSTPYDLVISDIRMPGAMDGRRLFLELKEKKPELTQRFVFITGDIMEAETAEFLKESGSAFLLKPFSINDLRKVVNKTLQESREKKDCSCL